MKALLALSIVVLLAGCTGSTVTDTGSSPPAPGSGSLDRKVDLHDNHYGDGNLTLSKGATVTYSNEGQRAHTVTVHWVGEPVTTLRLDKTLQPGEAVAFTFADAGTYHVWCRFHGTMTTGMATVVRVT